MEGFITSHGNGTRSRELLGGHQWKTWSSQADTVLRPTNVMLYLQVCVDKTLSTGNLLPTNSFKLIKVFE